MQGPPILFCCTHMGPVGVSEQLYCTHSFRSATAGHGLELAQYSESGPGGGGGDGGVPTSGPHVLSHRSGTMNLQTRSLSSCP